MSRLQPLFVWAVWAGMTVFAGLFVAKFGGRVPVQDDFFYLQLRLNRELPDASTLWCQLNEHRLPLPKLATWGIARVASPRPRNQMAIDLAITSGLAAALITAARRIRGHSHYTDAFFPLAMLTVGQSENLLWAVQINFFLPVWLQGTALILLVGIKDQLSASRALGLGLCAVALPLCGMQGVVTGTALAVWLLYAGLRGAATQRLAPVAMVSIAGLITAVLTAVYFVGYTSPAAEVQSRFDSTALRYALRVLAAGWGPATEEVSPAEPTLWPSPIGMATAVLVGFTAVRLLRATRNPQDWLAATGLLALLGGMTVVAAGIGYGRAGLSQGALVNRYVTLMVPILCACYLAWLRFPPPPLLYRSTVNTGMFLTAAVVAWPNAAAGLKAGHNQHVIQTAIERDIYYGTPASALAEQYGWYLFPLEPGRILPSFEALQACGVAPFHLLADEPTLREVPIRWQPDSFPAADHNGWIEADDLRHVFVTVSLDEPQRFPAIRIRYSLVGTVEGSSEAYWQRPMPSGGNWSFTAYELFAPGEGKEKQLWLGEGVNRIRIIVRGRVRLRIEEVTAFVEE